MADSVPCRLAFSPRLCDVRTIGRVEGEATSVPRVRSDYVLRITVFCLSGLRTYVRTYVRISLLSGVTHKQHTTTHTGVIPSLLTTDYT